VQKIVISHRQFGFDSGAEFLFNPCLESQEERFHRSGGIFVKGKLAQIYKKLGGVCQLEAELFRQTLETQVSVPCHLGAIKRVGHFPTY